MTAAYLDASAIVKLFKPEHESVSLAEALDAYDLWVSNEVVAVEALCSARRAGDGDGAILAAAVALMASVELMPLTASLRERAAAPFDRPLRALDAIHAATAVSLAEDLAAVVTYDADLFGALKAEGLAVFAPGPV